MISTKASIGPHWVGEIPEPLDITVQTDDGGVMDCTAATGVSFRYTVNGGATQTGTAALQNGPTGVLRVTFTGAEFATAGMLRGVVYFTLSGTRLVAGVVTCRVLTPPAAIS